MKKPKFVICYPKGKVEADAQGNTTGQQKLFYDNLKIALDEMGYSHKFINLPYTVPKTFDGDICFVFHTIVYGGRKNVWCVKDGSIFNHWEIDNRGWAGWSEMANSKTMFDESQKVDLDQAREFFDKFSNNYIQNNISKCTQPNIQKKLNIKDPYLFFPGQIAQDSVVTHHAKIGPFKHATQLIKHLESSEYAVVFKKHPGLDHLRGKTRGRSAVTVNGSRVIQFSGSIHNAISNAAGVAVINSGVGFESLLYKKHVFVSGHCDYHWVAHKIYSVNDMKKIPEILKSPVDEEKIIKFVYYMLTEVYVNATSIESIKNKIRKIVKAYEDNK